VDPERLEHVIEDVRRSLERYSWTRRTGSAAIAASLLILGASVAGRVGSSRLVLAGVATAAVLFVAGTVVARRRSRVTRVEAAQALELATGERGFVAAEELAHASPQDGALRRSVVRDAALRLQGVAPARLRAAVPLERFALAFGIGFAALAVLLLPRAGGGLREPGAAATAAGALASPAGGPGTRPARGESEAGTGASTGGARPEPGASSPGGAGAGGGGPDSGGWESSPPSGAGSGAPPRTAGDELLQKLRSGGWSAVARERLLQTMEEGAPGVAPAGSRTDPGGSGPERSAPADPPFEERAMRERERLGAELDDLYPGRFREVVRRYFSTG